MTLVYQIEVPDEMSAKSTMAQLLHAFGLLPDSVSQLPIPRDELLDAVVHANQHVYDKQPITLSRYPHLRIIKKAV